MFDSESENWPEKRLHVIRPCIVIVTPIDRPKLVRNYQIYSWTLKHNTYMYNNNLKLSWTYKNTLPFLINYSSLYAPDSLDEFQAWYHLYGL